MRAEVYLAWCHDDPTAPADQLDTMRAALEAARVRHTVDAVRRTQEAFLSSTRLQGRDVLRLCFINWRTQAADVERVVGLLAREAGVVTDALQQGG